MDALLLHRLHFAFTVTYHYLFPQLTMGLALLIVVLKTVAITRKDERYSEAARFWSSRVIAVNRSDGMSGALLSAISALVLAGSGPEYLPSTFSLASLPEFPWNFSSARTGRSLLASREE